jgi:hypothetical protein
MKEAQGSPGEVPGTSGNLKVPGKTREVKGIIPEAKKVSGHLREGQNEPR